MRLHRRKEAGIVVDFAEVGAPHSERVVTLHSLLDVDAYRPAGLVTPPPPRRRRGRRKPPKPIVKELPWIVPVSDNPERRVAVIASQWKLVDASKLPLDEQRAWAVVAARQLTPADVHTLTDRIINLAPEARELFFYTCAAENRHRKMRLSGLGDLATSGPSQTTFAMACRLVEAAPTWQQDRGQGARVLLLAMGDAKIEAPADRIVSWTWRLARAARDHEYRYAGAHIDDGRGLLGAVANAKTDTEHSQACLRLAQVAKAAPLEAGAALLAVASPRRGTAGERIVEMTRTGLSADPSGSRRRSARTSRPRCSAPSRRRRPSARPRPNGARRSRSTASWSDRHRPPSPCGASRARPRSRSPRRSRCACETTQTPSSASGWEWRSSTGSWPATRRVFETAVGVRAAAVEVSPLQVVVSKLLNEPVSDRVASIAVDGAGLVVPLEPAEAQVLADDAARRVLAQLKAAGVRGRVRVEFEVVDGEGAPRATHVRERCARSPAASRWERRRSAAIAAAARAAGAAAGPAPRSRPAAPPGTKRRPADRLRRRRCGRPRVGRVIAGKRSPGPGIRCNCSSRLSRVSSAVGLMDVRVGP